MVSLSDIPIVGKAVDKISEATVNAVYRGLRYMFCYKNLVNNFNSEFDKFNVEEGRVSTKVDEERDNGKIIKDNVTKWQKEVEEIQQDSKEFLERYENRASWKCIKCVPIPNPFNRFRIGRDAEKKAEKFAALTQSGKDLLANPIARLPPVENLPKTDGEFQNFQSREDAYEKIWKSLVSESGPQILGIYGLPGVGKTRIADQIRKEAKEKGIFKKVTKAVVSSEKYLDVKRLQNELAGDLNCSLESQDDIKRRASQLKQSIINGDKVLIILDNVWREIPLHDIGIPIGHDDTISSEGTCKILLTSREENVLRGNNCIDPVKITALRDEEAWDMFKDSVGTHKIESLRDEFLAKEVCNKCCGLPLLIRVVGKELRNMSGNVLEDTLHQLEKYRIERIPGIDQRVYACLKLSFNNLVDDDAKACLLLCSLYPEDAYISIDMLVELATGSELLPGGRSRVLSMVDILKSSSLVIGYEYDKRFKLHDIIRDVTRSIAVRDPYAFLFAKCDSRLPSINYGSTKVLCLEVKESDDWLNQDIQMTENDIHTLWIESAASDPSHNIQVREVASMFVNLRCLILRKIEWEVPVEHYLGKLRTLVLDDCDIRKTDFNFISGKLETLCIWGCHLPEPLNIINLKHLRKLQIRGTIEDVVLLVANTSMKSLEIRCDEEIKLNIPCTWDLRNLEELTLGNCWWHEQQIIPSFSRLRKLKVIKSGQSTLFPVSVISSLQQQLQLLEISDCALLEDIVTRGNAEASITDKKIIEFIQLKRVVLKDLPKLRCFMSGADYECHMPALEKVEIVNCGFSTLFPLSVISSLQQLEEIQTSNCALLEGIVEEDVMKRGNIEASSSRDKKKKKTIKLFGLKYVTLRNLPNLRSFMSGADYECHMPALSNVEIDNCGFSTLFPFSVTSSDLQQLWDIKISNCALLEGIVEEDVRRGNIEASNSREKKKIIKLFHLEKVILKDLPNLRSFMSGADYECHMPALEKVEIGNCGFSTLFPFSVISSDLQQLEEIEISNCALLEGIVEEDARRGNIEASSSRDKKKKNIIKLFHLKRVILKDLPNLRSFMYGADYECHMPALTDVKIDNCGFSTLFTCSTSLQELCWLVVSNCRLLEYIVRDDDDDSDDDDDISKTDDKIITTLSHLWNIRLENLPNLKSFSRASRYAFNMPVLSDFTLLQCPQVENFSSLKISTGRSIYVISDWD